VMAREAPRSSPAIGPMATAGRGIEQTCPRCGVTVRVRSAALAVRYCPHCVARAHVATPMPMVPRSTG